MLRLRHATKTIAPDGLLKPPNGFELSGQGYDHPISIRHATLVRCSEWLCGAFAMTPFYTVGVVS